MKRKITTIVITTLLLLVSATFLSFAAEDETNRGKDNLISIAHRGASGYAPENTMAAFEKAVEMGADYIEIDVQMSRDGVPIIIHDDTLDRTTDGEGSLSVYTLEELKELDAGSWFDEEFAGETIPTLDEVLKEFGGRINILLELKSPEYYPGIEEKVVESIKRYNLAEPGNNEIIIQSFNHASVMKSKELLPQVPHGVLVGKDWKNVTDDQLKEFATYADYFHPNFNIVTAELVDRVHQVGMTINPYTIKKKSEAKKLHELGVDGLITDYPEYTNISEL